MPLREVFKLKVIAGVALTLLFGSGIVVGMAWERTVSASTPEDVSDETRSERRGERRRHMVFRSIVVKDVRCRVKNGACRKRDHES